MSRFYIGQKVVAKYNHPEEYYRKNEIVIVSGNKQCPCGCGTPVVSVGVLAKNNLWLCGVSGNNYHDYSKEASFLESDFEPVIEDLSKITIEEFIEQSSTEKL